MLQALKDDPELREIPVVLVTIMGDRDMGFALGAADFVTKPFDRDVLIQAVNRHRRGRRRRRRSWSSTTTRDRATCCGGRCRRRAGRWPRPPMAAKRSAELERSRPALVLLDLMMPEMDGFEVLERMRREDAWRDIPVIVVTAKDLTREEVDRLNGQRGQGVAEGHLPAPRPARRRPGHAGRGVRASARRRRLPSRLATDCTGKLRMPKILLVEDNEMNRDMLSRRLQRRGYEVLIAVDGEQGIAQATRRAAGSDPDGHEPAGGRRLGGDAAAEGGARDREHPGHRADRARDGDRPGQSLEAGCDDYDTKPVEIARLLEKIERLLGAGRAMRRGARATAVTEPAGRRSRAPGAACQHAPGAAGAGDRAGRLRRALDRGGRPPGARASSPPISSAS